MASVALAPIKGCTFGRQVLHARTRASDDLTHALHEHGMLLFRGLAGITSTELAARVDAWFPKLAIDEPRANRPGDGGPVSVLGSTRDEHGNFNADYVPAATDGAALLSADGGWDEDLERSLQNWIRQKNESTFMEWHTDATFARWPTSYAALYCKQPGGSATGYASATRGLSNLPEELRQISETAVCVYRPSIIYGNAKLGIPAIGSRAVQLSAMRADNYAGPSETDGSLEVPPHPDDPVVQHKLVQTHPHTGSRSLRFSLKSLDTLIDAPETGPMPHADGKRTAWKIMRRATAGAQAYLHQWRQGDLMIWDERKTMHCRVPYDADNQVREMWRIAFRGDPADQTFNESSPQLNLG
jgi:alpha-ketoglutarate-dependent taurine dioxygenase